MGPFRGPYRGSPLRDPCWWAVLTEVAAHWEEVLMGLFRGGTHSLYVTNYIFTICIIMFRFFFVVNIHVCEEPVYDFFFCLKHD